MTALLDWLRGRIVAVALSAASFIAFVSLIAPAWLDFVLDLSMVGIIAIVGKFVKPPTKAVPRPPPPDDYAHDPARRSGGFRTKE
jgi:hypothetical protein